MRLHITQEGNIAAAAVSGDLVASSADGFMSEAAPLVRQNARVLIDMSNVGFMDSSGLRACMAISKQVREKGGTAVFAELSEPVRKVFSMTMADQKVIIAPTRSAGIEALRGEDPAAVLSANATGSGRSIGVKIGREFEDVDAARKAIRGFCNGLLPAPEHQNVIDEYCLAITEAMNNAVEHSGAPEIDVTVSLTPVDLVFIMVTPGAAFDPRGRSAMPDLDASEELPEGGFGLAIIHEVMDEVLYDYRDGKNVLTLKKNISNITRR